MSARPVSASGVQPRVEDLFMEVGMDELPPFTNPKLDWVATHSSEPLVKSLTFLPWIKIATNDGRHDAALPRSV